MLHRLVPTLDGLAGRLVTGMLNLASFHPIVFCLVIAVVAGAAAAVLLDAVTGRGPARTDERPIKLRHR